MASASSRGSVPDTLEWGRCLQVSPFESVYLVQPKSTPCPQSRTPSAVGFVVDVWVDCAKRQCHFCKTTWVGRDFAQGLKSYAPHKDQR